LLAYYTSSEPEKVKISVSDKGKPAILSNMYNIYFNISHSENLIVIAICKGKEIGVDIEIIRTDRNIASISKHYFNYNEKVNFENIEDSLKLLYFYYLWTFKEALLKAQGVGLTASIKDICLILREPDLHKMFYEGKYNFNCEDFVFSIFKLTGCFVSSLAVKI
jgi:4'-phosphopantetheinyl transferase